MKKFDLRKLIVTAVLVAVAIVVDVIISYIPGLNLSMPMGGKFFGISMIPLILIGLIFGLKYGLLGGFIYALYNFSFDYLIYLSVLKSTLESWTGTNWTVWHIIGLIAFDYLIPFTAFGLSGLFYKDNLKSIKNVVYSVLLVSLVRWVSATFSGVLLWGSSIKYAVDKVNEGTANADIATKIFESMNGNLVLYSGIYNSIYILSTGIVVTLIIILIRKRLLDITEQLNLNPSSSIHQ
ncbi:energy-coupled thiamine transporter ThiT [Haploplasma axanthum]|uniref:Thiamine ECF transporter S component ThiT n=1 Tax=Haploplasma axanthum TaxID=29552 RepID=A0A449BED3_HAPAX|nr:energy-coupled thiamine transporter ThiT [Haploplasma axanthum]VEU80811.1 Thiamine ECF transporter S component ThiT [Haploplasma axanthum]